MSKILLDTNVLIYAIDQDSVFYAASRTILDSEDNLFTTSKNLSEFLAVITRAPVISLSIEDALAALDDLTNRLIGRILKEFQGFLLPCLTLLRDASFIRAAL